MRQQKRGGSHYVFKHPKLEMFVVLVTHGKNDVLPEYQVLKAMRALERLSQHKDTEQ
jgi:predicted RNA binding protein YcfA (HicA-like mRNA interferase family)